MLENLGQVLPVAAQKYGDKTALVIDGRSFSFNDLNHLSGRLANGLRDLGIAAGDRVTLCSQNCWEWIVSFASVQQDFTPVTGLHNWNGKRELERGLPSHFSCVGLRVA